MPTNALYSQQPRNALTVDDAVQNMLGMQPGMDRLNLLPRHDKNYGWIAPNFLYQLARAAVAPGVAAHGGYVSPEDAVNFAGNVSLGSYGVSRAVPNAAPGPGKTLPMTVYHGSPHNFDAFDISKIGTGEGAQAYGHGLYVAENPGVAKSYAVNLADRANPRDVVNSFILNRTKGGSIAGLRESMTQHELLGPIFAKDPSLLEDALTLARGYEPATNTYTDAAVKAASRLDTRLPTPKGNIYHVDLPDSHIAKMLDWDKPLSQQPENVRQAIEQYAKDAGYNWKGMEGSITGEMIYRQIQNDSRDWAIAAGRNELTTLPASQARASQHLAELGIPGIKYFDGGSRAAAMLNVEKTTGLDGSPMFVVNGPRGDVTFDTMAQAQKFIEQHQLQQTRNYVVFDDKLLKILKKE